MDMVTRIYLIFSLIIHGCGGFLSLYPNRLRKQLTTPTRSVQKWIRLATANQENWEPGDVDRDLILLEQAINFENAEQNLKHFERLEMMDYCAAQRRPVADDFRRFIVVPLTCSLALRVLAKNRAVEFTTRMISSCMDFQFWIVAVSSPLILSVAKLRSKPERDEMPEELKMRGSQYSSFGTTCWDNPAVSSEDHVLFLLEYWTSAVFGMGIFGVLCLLKLIPDSEFVRCWLPVAQLLARLGVIASLHQYQGPLFRLLRHQQPRPIGFFPALLQSLVRCMFASASWGLTFDLLKTLKKLRNDSIVALYASVTALLFGTWIRMQQKDLREFQKLEKNCLTGKIVQLVATIAFWKKPIANLCRKVQSASSQNWFPNGQKALLVSTRTSMIGLLPIVGPIMHMSKIVPQFRIVYTHDLSLSMDPTSFRNLLMQEAEMEERTKWRYRIEWREEKRLRPVLKKWKSSLGHWWLVKGSVAEKLEQEHVKQLRESMMKGKRVWEKMEEDGLPKPDRNQWKRDAMERIAQKHQEDYDSGEFDDPLGVAVYRTFGIGLGYKFDHMRDLEKNEKPSTRRLQARAAKSAIKRVGELYDAAGAQKELDGIQDPKERNKRARELREQVDTEIKYLAKRLSELVPTAPSSEFKDRVVQLRTFTRTSANELVVDGPFDDYSIIQQMLHKKNSDENEKDSSKEIDSVPDGGYVGGDDFVDAYLDQLENDSDEKIFLA
eukprot:scaffold721_cov131-Cylindrotheca_fusiformis.AAC.54